MFTYTNPGFILITGFITFAALLIVIYNAGKAQHNGTDMEIPYVPIIGAIISIIIAIWDGDSTYKTIK